LYQKALSEQKPFDLVIVDLKIPGTMDGRRTMQELLKIDPSVKAIVSSGLPNRQGRSGSWFDSIFDDEQ
jgi:DNA-binding NarL/FixJ family response regulator